MRGAVTPPVHVDPRHPVEGPDRAVHGAHPPAVAHPDVRLVLGGARHTSNRVLALPCGLGFDDRIQRFDPQVPLERKAWPGNKIRKTTGAVGHETTLAEPFAAVVPRVVGPPPYRLT